MNWGKLPAAVLTLLALAIASPALQAADIAEGFLGRGWGTPISQLPEFEKSYEKGVVAYYVNPGEVFTVGEVRVPDVVYGFYEGRLFAVYLNIATIEIYSQLRAYLQKNYGVPETTFSTKSEERELSWSHLQVRIKLKLNEKNSRMKLAFYQRAMARQANESELETPPDKAWALLPVQKDKTPENVPLLQF